MMRISKRERLLNAKALATQQQEKIQAKLKKLSFDLQYMKDDLRFYIDDNGDLIDPTEAENTRPPGQVEQSAFAPEQEEEKQIDTNRSALPDGSNP